MGGRPGGRECVFVQVDFYLVGVGYHLARRNCSCIVFVVGPPLGVPVMFVMVTVRDLLSIQVKLTCHVFPSVKRLFVGAGGIDPRTRHGVRPGLVRRRVGLEVPLSPRSFAYHS